MGAGLAMPTLPTNSGRWEGTSPSLPHDMNPPSSDIVGEEEGKWGNNAMPSLVFV